MSKEDNFGNESRDNQFIENELRDLEKELGTEISQLEPAPLREGFMAELGDSLQTAINSEKQPKLAHAGEQNSRIALIWEKMLSGLRLFKRRKVQLTAGILLIAFIFGTIFWDFAGFNPVVTPVYAGEIMINALETDQLGVNTESAFLITSKNPLTEKIVEQNLQIQPAFEYSLQKGAGGKEYQIIPKKELSPDTVYSFSFDPEGKARENFSWAFQTKASFRVLRSLPGNQSTGVPVDTGIEITFTHENFDLGKVQKHFQISPQVEGRFEQHKKTLVFVPKQQLQPATLYTVTLEKGLPMLGSKETLAEDYCFSFETRGIEEEKFSFEMDNNLVEFSTFEAPFFSVFFYADKKAPPAMISLYKYADNQDFIKALAKKDQFPTWSYHSRRNYREDLSGLTKFAEYKTDFLTEDKYSHYLIFPEELPSGYYVAEIKAEEARQQIWFQITDLAVYLIQDEEKNLFWINDLQTESPVAGATVYLEQGERSFKGNEQGIAIAEFAAENSTYALIKKDAQEIVVPVFAQQQRDPSQPQQIQSRDYWKYLYLDRELFKPGDMVNFWGVLAPRKGAEPIREVVVELMNSGSNYYSRSRGEEAPILSQKVQLEQELFTGGLELPVLSPGYYYLRVKYGETVLLSRGFSVETYQKPAYKISVEPEQKAIFAGDKVDFLAKAAFFEGTPVPKVGINYSVWDQRGTVNTNAQGEATIPFVTKKNAEEYDYYNAYRSFYLGVNAALPEAGEISTSSNVLVFASKVFFEGEVKKDSNGFALTGQLSHVNLEKINQGEYPERDNFVSGPAAGYPIKGKVIQDKWEKVGDGRERYNFITKKVEKTYYYEHSTQEIGEFTVVSAADGKVSYHGDYALDPEGSYYLELTAQDQEGRQTKNRMYIFRNSGNYDDYHKFYQLQREKEGAKYLPGEKVTLNFTENEQATASKKQGYLFYQGQKVIDTYQLNDQPQYTFDFTAEHIPNVNVGAVYFDGMAYHGVYYPMTVPYDPAAKELKVTIETDQKEYRPKDKVKLNILVTDQKGKPVQAKVNLNLVDEALYSMVDQKVDLLGRLYTDYLRLSINTRASHVHPEFRGGAEQGGEGDGERKDFFDTVLFTTVETNNRGQASAEFTLPDNLTSWRLTYHGVASDLQVASGTAQIPVSLPFFVEMVAKETYLKGDAPIIVVRSYGEKVTSQSPVSYVLTLTTPAGEKMVQKAQGQVAASTDWQLPALQVGNYKLTVEGAAGEFSDKLSQEINVVASYLERSLTTQQVLMENLTLTGGSVEPTTIIFSDYEKSQYLQGLYSLAWQSGGRLEQKLASREARKLLTQYFSDGRDVFADEEEGLLTYQQYDGGVSILPYAESELALTALVASVGSKDFDYGAMSGYFYSRLEKGEVVGEDLTSALWGLAALGEPVLLEINKYLEQGNLSPAEKVHLALALLDSGDGAYANQVYVDLLAQYGENLGSSLRMKIGRDQDEVIFATTQMALLAARLDTPEKNSLYQYVLENPGTEILTNLEQLQILQYQLQYLENEPVSFTYELNGKKEKMELEGRETFTLTVLPQDLAKLKFSKITGKVGVMTAYSQSYGQEDIPEREDLKVSRAYLVNNQEVNTLQRGDLVEVVLNYEIKDLAPGGSYELVDILPAGLSYVQKPYQRTQNTSVNLSYPSEVKGQKITFNLWKERKTGQTAKPRPIVYYARVVSPGEFIAQGTLMSHSKNNDICILGQEDRVVIK